MNKQIITLLGLQDEYRPFVAAALCDVTSAGFARAAAHVQRLRRAVVQRVAARASLASRHGRERVASSFTSAQTRLAGESTMLSFVAADVCWCVCMFGCLFSYFIYM